MCNMDLDFRQVWSRMLASDGVWVFYLLGAPCALAWQGFRPRGLLSGSPEQGRAPEAQVVAICLHVGHLQILDCHMMEMRRACPVHASPSLAVLPLPVGMSYQVPHPPHRRVMPLCD